MSPQHLTSEHFESWRTRDEPPYEVLLGWFFDTFYGLALRVMRGDEAQATDLLENVFFEIEEVVKDGRVQWRSESAFAAFVRRILLWRQMDAARRRARGPVAFSLYAPLGGDDDDDSALLDVLRADTQTPEQLVVDEEEAWAAVTHCLKGVLIPFRDHLRSLGRDALVQTADAVLAYVEGCLRAAAPHSAATDGLDACLASFRPDCVSFEKSACYRYVMETLKINRAALDQRMKHLRRLMQEWQAAQALSEEPCEVR